MPMTPGNTRKCPDTEEERVLAGVSDAVQDYLRDLDDRLIGSSEMKKWHAHFWHLGGVMRP